MKENFAQLLNRIATEHFDRKLKKYIGQLENVAQAAKTVATSLPESQAIIELRKTLEDLDAA